jgi:DNA primase
MLEPLELSESQILDALDQSGVTYDSKYSDKEHAVLCPYHNDSKFGNAFVNKVSGQFYCFACHKGSHVISIFRKQAGLSHAEACSRIGLEVQAKNKVSNISQRAKKKQNVPPANSSLSNTHQLTRPLYHAVPSKPAAISHYGERRGVDKEFIDKHNIRTVTSGFYAGYAMIPMTKDCTSVEFRKWYKAEHLSRLAEAWGFPLSDPLSSELKNRLQEENQRLYDYLVRKPKVLYPKGQSKDFLFRSDMTDTNRPLYITEGIMSLAKVKKVYPNATSLFGSDISEGQIKELIKYPELIVLSDRDYAGIDLLHKFNSLFGSKVNVMDVPDDTDPTYREKLESPNVYSIPDYLVNRLVLA